MEEQEAIRRIIKASSRMQALVAEPDVFYTEAALVNCTDKEICETFSSIRLNRVPIKGGMYTRKNSPFIERFNYGYVHPKHTFKYGSVYIYGDFPFAQDDSDVGTRPESSISHPLH